MASDDELCTVGGYRRVRGKFFLLQQLFMAGDDASLCFVDVLVHDGN